MPIKKSEEEWRAQLTAEQFQVTRRKGTERAFTGKYWDNKEPGTYRCVCCGQELFDANAKYDSCSGWPSFFQPLNAEHLKLEEDRSFWQTRTEVLCRNCNAHLGHVFPDGPQPTGQRYCMNSVALDFEARDNVKAKEE